MDCVFPIGDICVSSMDLFIIGLVLVILVFGYLFVLPAILENLKKDQDGQIQQTQMVYESSTPTYDEPKAPKKYQPYKVGDMIFVGEKDGLGAKLEVVKYDDEYAEMECKLWIEAPIGSTCIRVDYVPDSRYKLGSALIEYTDPQGNAFNVEIGISDDEIYNNNDYTLVVECSQSTFNDIREV